MDGYIPFTDRVTQGEDGKYRWKSPLTEKERKMIPAVVFGVCGGMMLIFLIFAFVMDKEMLGVMLLCTAAVMGICCLVYFPMRSSLMNQTVAYLMDEEAIIIRPGTKDSQYCEFASVRLARLLPNRLELRTALGVGAITLPPEDAAFVTDFVVEHLPRQADLEDRREKE